MPASALEQAEEAVNLLRRQRARSWMLYLLGAVPLLLSLLTFARDMRSGFGADQCLAESLMCAMAFFWASFWKARFAGTLLTTLGENGEAVKRNRTWECVFVQSVLQAFKLCLLPFAVISVVPLPWVSALFRRVNAESNRAGATVSNTLKRAASEASTDGRKNWIGMLIFSVSAIVVFVNVFAILLALPELWKVFTGFETDWTRNVRNIENANTFAVALALTWLIVDPLLQAYSAVRSFYFEARSDGRDLLVRLRHLAVPAVILAFLLGAVISPAAAAGRDGATITDADINRSVEQVAAKHEYDWLRAAKVAPADDWFGGRVLRGISRGIHRAKSAISDFVEKLFRHDEQPNNGKKPARPRAPRLQWLMYGLAGLLAIAIVLVVMRTRRNVPLAITAGAAGTTIDLTADGVLASERPEEQWLAMARDYAGTGELRLAIRAMYLSNLAYLGARQLIGISKSKSNSIYERELRLRCHDGAVRQAFACANRNYERIWYGMHDATPDLRDIFEQEVWAVRGRG